MLKARVNNLDYTSRMSGLSNSRRGLSRLLRDIRAKESPRRVWDARNEAGLMATAKAYGTETRWEAIRELEEKRVSTDRCSSWMPSMS